MRVRRRGRRGDNEVKFVEAYSEEISTLYSQVWWTMGPLYKFPQEFVTEYDNKTMARALRILTRELCSCARFSLAETLVLAGTAGAGRIAQSSSTRKCTGRPFRT